MRRQTLLWAVVTLFVVGWLALGIALLMAPETALDRALRANYKRVEVGMDRNEVSGILGSPGDQTDGSEKLLGSGWYVMSDGGGYWDVWYTDNAGVIVFFDASDKVEDKRISLGCNRQRLNPLERFQRYAERQWRRWFP
jgi:hypothetical protein